MRYKYCFFSALALVVNVKEINTIHPHNVSFSKSLSHKNINQAKLLGIFGCLGRFMSVLLSYPLVSMCSDIIEYCYIFELCWIILHCVTLIMLMDVIFRARCYIVGIVTL